MRMEKFISLRTYFSFVRIKVESFWFWYNIPQSF